MIKIPILDAGHGGWDAKAGKYTTEPDKMFAHQKGQFHNDRTFLEGVFNRTVTHRVSEMLSKRGIHHLHTIPFSELHADISLKRRVEFANHIHSPAKGVFCLFISNHANAFNAKVRGFEVYTSPNDTEADKWAERLYKHTESLLGHKIRMRPDLSDGDHDKEERFYVLTKTQMPAILVEHLFFDNYEDAILLMNPDIVGLFAEAQCRTIEEWMLT